MTHTNTVTIACPYCDWTELHPVDDNAQSVTLNMRNAERHQLDTHRNCSATQSDTTDSATQSDGNLLRGPREGQAG